MILGLVCFDWTILFWQSFLISKVTLDNCVDIGHVANAYNLTYVDHHVNVYMLRNFNLVNDFNKVPFERLAFLLSSNTLKVRVAVFAFPHCVAATT